MNKILLNLFFASALAATFNATASPEADRKQLIETMRHEFPAIKQGDYIYGALIYSRDSKAQYDSLMDFPPFENQIEKGRVIWEAPFRNGKSFASCFPNGGKMVAGNYPYFDEESGKVVTFEMALNKCRKVNGEPEFGYDDMSTMGVLTAYARKFSDGMKMNIHVDTPRAQAAYEAGKGGFYGRRGQLNFSCASCHIDNVGKIVRTEYMSPVPGQTTHWPVFREGENLFTLQKRYAACNVMTRAIPQPLGSEYYNNIEYYHSYQSNGLVMKASVFRK